MTDELLRRFGWEGLKDVTLVFPMHRAGVVMRSELQRRMEAEHPSALWAPEMLALSDLFDSLCPLGKEDELFTVCRLHRIYTECLQGTPMEIDRFYSWGRQLLSDFTNIDQSISPEELSSFFRNALSLADLDTYKLDEEVRRRLEDLLYRGEARTQSLITDSVRAHFAALWQAMPDIYHRLGDELLQDGLGYEGQRMRYVVTHWPEVRERAGAKTYCFIGFNYLLPVERQLMQQLHDEGRALFFWDYVEDFRTNSKAFAFIRQNMRTLPNALPAARWGAPRHVRTLSANSVHSEAEYAGQWLQQTYHRHGEATAVVICDEAQLEPVIYSLPSIRPEGNDEAEQVNITKGYPMRHTHEFAELVRQLDKAFRQHADNPQQALQDVVAHLDERATLNAQQSTLNDQPLTWQWHLSREALYQARRTLIRFITILQDGLVAQLTTHTELLRRLILRHLEQLTLPFHGEPVTDIQVMGVLETRTLDFDHLLLLNVEEGVIPAHRPDQSFLPYYLRKAYGLQTHDERASVYAYNFFRLLHRAGDVTIVFSQAQTAMTRKTMSRFVMQMLVCPEEFTVSKFTLTESNTLRPAVQLAIDEATVDSKLLNRQLYLSPSAINTFYTCKRMFYLQYILGLSEQDEAEVIFSNRTLGLFVHEAVHYLYEHYCHCDNTAAVRIYPNQVEQMNTPERRLEAIRVAYDRLNTHLYEQHALENRVMDTYIAHVLDRDRYDAEHSGLTIRLLEYPLRTSFAVHCSPFTVQLGGRLDRMDSIGGLNGLPEVTRIVDYKCGRYDPAKMSATSDDLLTPEAPDTDYVRQTLFYSFIAYQSSQYSSIEPHLYFTSRKLAESDTVTGVRLDRQPLTCSAETEDAYADLILRMISSILAERDFPCCRKCPPYCPFLQLCDRKAAEY